MPTSRFHLYVPQTHAPAASRAVRNIDGALRWGLAIFAFLLPLLGFPFGARGAEFWKQEFLMFGVGVILILWIVKSALTRAIELRITPAGLWAWAFLLAAALSAMAAPGISGSMFGADRGGIGPLAIVLAMVLWYAVASSTISSAIDVRRIFLALQAAALAAGTVGLLSFFGIPPFGGEGAAPWTPSGTPLALGAYLAAMLLAAPAAISLPPHRRAFLRTATRALIVGSALVSVAYLAILDSWIIWVSLLIGAGTLLLIVPLRLQDTNEPRRFLIPMIPAALALWLIFDKLPFISAPAAPPSHWSAVVSALRSFGHGLPDWGILAVVAFTVFIVVTMATSGRRILQAYSWSAPAGVLAASVALSVFFLLGPAGIAPQFLFWTFAALLAAGSAATRSLSLDNKKYGPAIVALLTVVAGLSATLVFGGGARAVAAVEEVRARSALVHGDESVARRRLRRATLFAWYEDGIARLQTEMLLARLRQMNDANNEAAGGLIQEVIASGRRTTRLDPANPENWRTLASVYRSLSRAVAGSGFAAVAAGERAVTLDPTDAATMTELARDRRLLAEELMQAGKDDLAKEFLTNAEDELGRALEVAPEYGQALFELAMVYERQGRTADALAWMELVQRIYPWDVGVAFELGKMYAEAGRENDAEAQFLRAVRMVPSFANARWFLANLYVGQGKLADAKIELESIARLDPGNKLVLQQLEALQHRLAAKR